MKEIIKYRVAPEFKELESWISQLPANFPVSGQTIFKLRNEVKVFTVGNFQLNVKAFKVPNLINRLVYVYLRPSKAARSYEFARRFDRIGVPTPQPVGFVECTNNHLLGKSYYISLQVNCNYTLSEALDFPIEKKDEILRQWVQFTYKKLHKNGIFHPDYSPANTLITDNGGQYHFSIVDLNRIIFGPISFKKGLSNFCRLKVDHSTLRMIGREYALLRGENADQAEKLMIDIYRQDKVNLQNKQFIKDFLKRLFRYGRGVK